MPPLVRAATDDDLGSVARIYGHTVRTGVGTFDLTDPPDDYWTAKLGSTQAGDHLLVADNGGAVIGFAYSSAFRPRPAYAQTRETSVYLAPDAVGAGVGSALYAELLRRLRDDGMHVAVAVIAQPNPASVALHEKFGFELVGTLREVGRKFDRWIDTRWYQLRLGQ